MEKARTKLIKHYGTPNEFNFELTAKRRGMSIRQLDGDAESPQLYRCRILFGRQQDALRFDIPMNDVVLVAISQRLQDLSHIMAGKFTPNVQIRFDRREVRT